MGDLTMRKPAAGRERYRRLATRIAAAMLAGLGLGCLYVLTLAGGDDPSLPTMLGPDRLLTMLSEAPASAGAPQVRRVIVYPLDDLADRAQLVTFDLRVGELSAGKVVPGQWVRHKTWVGVPLSEGRGANLEEYVATLRAGGKLATDVRTGWWTRPWPTIPLFAGAGAFVCASWLIAQFVWRGPLARMRGLNAPPLVAGPRELSADDAGQLDDALARLSAGTHDGGVMAAPRTDGRATTSAPRALSQDRDRPFAPKTKAQKDYEGQYYPVEKNTPH